MTYVWPFATGIGGNMSVAIVYGYVLLLREAEALALMLFASGLLARRRVYTSPSSPPLSCAWARRTMSVSVSA